MVVLLAKQPVHPRELLATLKGGSIVVIRTWERVADSLHAIPALELFTEDSVMPLKCSFLGGGVGLSETFAACIIKEHSRLEHIP